VVSTVALGPSIRIAIIPARPARTSTIARIRTWGLTFSILRSIGIVTGVL
jgi:hypothetical protein